MYVWLAGGTQGVHLSIMLFQTRNSCRDMADDIESVDDERIGNTAEAVSSAVVAAAANGAACYQ